MSDNLKDSENKRAYRILFRLNSCHKSLATIYESLVDKEYIISEQEAKQIISEMRLIIKSIKHDDF